MKRLFLCLAFGSLISATPVRAEERDYDRFDIRAGGGWVFGADTTVSLIGARGVGTVIDFDKTLDGETSNSLFRVDGSWNWAKKHGLSYTWYDVNRTGYRAIDQDIEFGDTTFPVGATLSSQLDIKIHRLLYKYGLAREEKVNLDLGGGVYYANIGMTLTAVGNFGPVTDGTSKAVSLKAPLPTASLNLEYKWTPKLSSTFEADFFYFAYNDWEGALTDLQFGLAYKLTKHFTLGAAYDRFVINLEGPTGDDSHFQVDNAWNSLYSYLAFHW